MSDLIELRDELNLLADNFASGELKPGEFEVGVRGVAADLGARIEPLPELALPVQTDAHAVLESIYATLLTTALDDDFDAFGRLMLEQRERIEEAIGEEAIARINLEIVEMVDQLGEGE
jgi:hypothetical protein